jgi:hypothetical protein
MVYRHTLRMVCGVGAPVYRRFLFGEDDWVFHLVAGFGFEHEDRIGGFSHEIRLVFEMVGAVPVKDLELAPWRA